MLSTEEVTLAAMRRGRDGRSDCSLSLSRNDWDDRYDDVSQCCGGVYMLRILLGPLCRGVQRMA